MSLLDDFINNTEVLLLDLNHNQGPVNMETVKSKRIAGVLIRWSYGLQFDRLAPEYIGGAQDVGLPWGLYHAFWPDLNVVVQAEHFQAGLQAYPPKLGGWTDLEKELPPGVTTSQMWGRVSIYDQKVNDVTPADQKLGSYFRLEWLKRMGNPPPWFFARSKWLAQYNVKIAAPDLGYGISDWDVWQFSSDHPSNYKGKEYGAASINIGMNRFNGTIAHYRQVFKLEDPTIPDEGVCTTLYALDISKGYGAGKQGYFGRYFIGAKIYYHEKQVDQNILWFRVGPDLWVPVRSLATGQWNVKIG